MRRKNFSVMQEISGNRILQSGNLIYYSQGDTPGSITFNVLNNNRIEEYFSAVCKNSTDSVIVTGTFNIYYAH